MTPTTIHCTVPDATADIRRAIAAFIRTEVLNDASATIGESDELVGEGLIDSLGIVRLMVHLQRRYGIADFDKSDLTLDNFRTIARIADMIARYRLTR
jgi:acyl carrier protein